MTSYTSFELTSIIEDLCVLSVLHVIPYPSQTFQKERSLFTLGLERKLGLREVK